MPAPLWQQGLSCLAGRHPLLKSEADVASLLDAKVASDEQHIAVATRLWLQPGLTVAVAGCYRPVLLHLLSSALAQAEAQQAVPGRLAACMVAAVQTLEVGSYLARTVQEFLEQQVPPFQLLAALPPAEQTPAAAEHLSRATLRALQLLPELQAAWDCSTLYDLCRHQDPQVRWNAAHSVALMAQLSDAGKQQLLTCVLTPEQVLRGAWRERELQTCAQVEAAGAWMEGPGPPIQQQQQHTGPVGARHVQIGGVLVPSAARPLSHSSHAAAGQVVSVPSLEDSLSAAALALCQDKPLLLEGPPGAGKSALLQELARLTGNLDLMTVHMDDQMDSKTLLGAYVCTTRPGEFVWQPGPLTQAVTQGRWLLIEDINMAPVEVLAGLVPLLEARQLPLPQRGEVVRAAAGFQLLASVTTAPGGSSSGAYGSSQAVQDLLGGLWATVRVNSPPPQQQLQILRSLFPQLEGLLPTALATLDLVRQASGQSLAGEEEQGDAKVAAAMEAVQLQAGDASLHVARHFSLRDVVKWARRMQDVHGPLLARNQNTVQLKGGAGQLLPIGVREAGLLEALDCFAAQVANPQAKRQLAAGLAALWGVSPEQVHHHLELAKPQLLPAAGQVAVGRASLPVVDSQQAQTAAQGPLGTSFAQTGHAMRLLESVALAVQQQEPVLLVGETGTGKTTAVQQLAARVGARLTVLNLNQQTDSADLLGGFKPSEPGDTLQPLLTTFQDLVRRTWTKGNNEDFLGRVAKYGQRHKWAALIKAFHAAAYKVETMPDAGQPEEAPRSTKRQRISHESTAPTRPVAKVSASVRAGWQDFSRQLAAAEQAVKAAEGGLAFSFVEGALIRAVREGWWVLLDEINLAPPEALERIAGLLEGCTSSIVLAERGDAAPVTRHPGFRLLAAMNPATDAGKRDLPAPLRNRFTEIWVAEPSSREDMQSLVMSYLEGTGPRPPVDSLVDFYTAAKAAAASGALQDGAAQKPSYSLRTLCRALDYCRTAVATYGLQRALLDGLSMAFMTQLDTECAAGMEQLISRHVLGSNRAVQGLLRTPAEPPGGRHVLFEQFWIERGDQPLPETGAEADGQGRRFVMTPAVRQHVHNLARAVLVRKAPILLQGPTSSGKTSLVAYLAAQTGHTFVRINNHEQTDLQEYLGSYVTDEMGRLVFKEGALVQAVRRGHWIVLDELNLAPSEVLEALNRLLDDNRELFVPELRETVKPHPHFMLFATQNPPGIYGGRKVLSRAFRSRFLELNVGDIPDGELATILEQRCALAPSYAAKLVAVMRELYRQRQLSNVFAGRHGFITPRDLFKWAERGAVGYEELACNGYLLLAERLRSKVETGVVQRVLEGQMRVQLDIQAVYEQRGGAQVAQLQRALEDPKGAVPADAEALRRMLGRIVWTPTMRRMYTLLSRCLQHSEPALLVGETGTGKTTVCQMLALARGQSLHIINCNQHTETSDFLGGFRPVRGCDRLLAHFHTALQQLLQSPLLPAAERAQLEEAQSEAALDLMPLVQAARTVVQCCCKGGPSGPAEAQLQGAVDSMQEAAAAARAPFVWMDGPLVTAMRRGDMFLIDELNLAEDAVLERLNSVLEPGRTLTLAEKGGAGAEVVTAAPGFRLVATMNPGGDYGKKELSPALSNRFTQIWVPPVQDATELGAILDARLTGPAAEQGFGNKLLRFWMFFREQAGAARTALSIRDLLAWVDFINKAATGLGPAAAYAHGAHMVLLDGIGLGVGMPPQVATELRLRSVQFLASQLPDHEAELHAAAGRIPASAISSFHIESSDGMQVDSPAVPSGEWGIPPFFVVRGPHAYPPSSGLRFDFTAPTVARNALRTLRALQLRKAVLLEGSPGVGKSSLVTALAKESGQRLVRINLSEQTDMMDLLGADLPVEGGAAGEFAWCDGPLLSAVKAGDWVLLDELNLASQSVLEGLNAVLDHRAEAFIPELGQTFSCPPTFQLFAAQNPLQEGGGRKGLPKSFLNRFSRVHIDLLESADMLKIAGALHPALPAPCLQRMVTFVTALHNRINVQHAFGALGGPWEFNLRDLLRWCELVQAALSSRSAEASEAVCLEEAPHFARMLFHQRLRTPTDRQQVAALFESVWGTSVEAQTTPELSISPQWVQVGRAGLARPGRTAAPLPQREQLQLLASQQGLLESMLHCIERGWMPILVGPTASGKTSLVHLAAQLAGRPLSEVVLTSGTDTSDLLGGFEQLEPSRKLQAFPEQVWAVSVSISAELLLHEAGLRHATQLQQIDRAWAQHGALQRSASGAGEQLAALRTVLQHMQAALSALEQSRQTELGQALSQLHRDLDVLAAGIESAAGSGGRFEWVDGALTRAVETGQWILLDNANLCNPTVLDRLNALLEPGGQLMLNEAGSSSGQARVVAPHPNFRLFLAMSARHGEVSRAMRNRGIELFVDDEAASSELLPGGTAQHEELMLLSLGGVPGTALPTAMAAAHAALVHRAQGSYRRVPGRRELRAWVALASTLVQQGWPVGRALERAFLQAYTSAEASPAGREAAKQTFLEHCGGIHAASSGIPQALVRPAAWPLPLAADRFASDSQLSTLSRDAAPLEAYSAQLAAANLALTVQPEQLAHVWTHPQLASCLPAGLLQAALAGLAAPAPPAEALDAQGDRQREGQLRLLWLGALCCLEQQVHSSHQQLLSWLRLLEASLQGVQAVSPALQAVCIAAQAWLEAPVLKAIPAAGAADSRGEVAGMPQLLWAAAAQDARQLQIWAAAAPAVQAGTASIAQQSCWRSSNPQVRARHGASHPTIDWLHPVMAALQTWLTPLLERHMQLLSKQALQQVAAIQEWQAALWHATHGSLSAAGPSECRALRPELLVFTWQQLCKAVQRLLPLMPPQEAQARQMQDFDAQAVQLGRTLGLGSAPPPRPLLWAHAGHSELPATTELAEGWQELLRLCNSIRVANQGSTPEVRAPAADGSEAQQAGAVLAASPAARQALVHGLSLFQLAAVRLLHSAASGSQPRNLLATFDADAAQVAVQLTHSNLQQAVDKVTRGSVSQDDDSPAAEAEVLPAHAALLVAGRQLNDKLLPFQSVVHEQQLAHLMPRLLSIVLPGQCADRGGLASMCLQVLHAAISGCSADPARLWPLQLLAWLLQAQRDKCAATEQDVAVAGAARVLVHELQQAWHAHREQAVAAGSLGPYGPAQTQGVVALLVDHASPISRADLRAQQLGLAARHMRRWTVLNGQPSGSLAAASEWRSMAGLLAQILLAHARSMPETEGTHLRQAAEQLGQGETGPGMADAIRQGVNASSHHGLQAVAETLLMPCLACVAQGLAATAPAKPQPEGQHSPAQAAAPAAALRGQAWLLLGLCRLQLAAPPAGTDPAGKYALKQAHAERRLQEEVLPEMEVRRELQRLPGRPSQAAALAGLEAQSAGLRRCAAAMEARSVPRPQPPAYAAVQADVHRFVAGVAALPRMQSLLHRLQAGEDAAVQEAQSWQGSAAAWSRSLQRQHPLYADILGPVALGVHEACHGLSLLVHAAQLLAGDPHLGPALCSLMSFAQPAAAVLTSQQQEAVLRASMAHRPSSKPQEAEIATFSLSLSLLRVTLHQALEAACARPAGAALPSVQNLFERLLHVWEGIQAAEERMAAEEAELFKKKTQTSSILTEEEEEAASYQQQFPDHGAAFADIAAADEHHPMDEGPDQQSDGAQATAASDAVAGSAAAQQLLKGPLLHDLVAMHSRLVTALLQGAQADSSDPASWQQAFTRAYDTGASLVGAAQPVLPVQLDQALSCGHLMRTCLEQGRLAAAPGAGDVDIQAPNVEEARLLQSPVGATQKRLAELLEEWPEHPVLMQLDAICCRLQELPVAAPLKTALTGVELLLARAQLWEESAAKHVSLAPQLASLASLATRWRRLELASWRCLLVKTAERHAAGAHHSWFHLYRTLLLRDAALLDKSAATAVQQYLQTATLGEFAERLTMVKTFGLHASVLAQQPGSQHEGWQAAAASLLNTHQYFGQFQPHVERTIADSMAPLNKQLEDFVKLAKWEDRGYYAMRASTEKAQRQLHRLSRRAEDALRQPFAALLAIAAKTMGFEDLASTGDGIRAEGVAGSAVEEGQSRLAALVLSSPATAPKRSKQVAAQGKGKAPDDAEVMQEQQTLAWHSFCQSISASVTAATQAAARQLQQLTPELQSALAAQDASGLQHRLPQLAGRMQEVLGGSTDGQSPGAHLAALGAEAAQRALELRGLSEKGAAPRKKKALTDLLKALQEAGVSRRRSAIPADQRSVHSWFAQAGPGLDQGLLTAQHASSAVPEGVLQKGAQAWTKADAWYFRSMARLQTLWEAAKTPHQDLSLAEVEAAVRLSEHLLFLQRQQRQALGQAQAAAASLHALGTRLQELSPEGLELRLQAALRQHLKTAGDTLARVVYLARNTGRLLEGAAAAESGAPAKRQLQGAAAAVEAVIRQLTAQQRALQQREYQTRPMRTGNEKELLTAADHRELLDVWQVLQDVCSLANAADSQHGYSALAPGWYSLQEGLREAAQAADNGRQELDAAAQASGLGSAALVAQRWRQGMQAAISQLLLWAQAQKQTEGADDMEYAPVGQAMAALHSKMALPRLSEATAACQTLTQTLLEASSLPDTGPLIRHMLGSLGALQPLLSLAGGSLRLLALQYLALHRDTAKLGYITTSLMAGVVREGFCISEEAEGDGQEGGEGTFKESEGTGLGAGKGARDISDQLENEDQLLGSRHKDQPEEKEEEQAQHPDADQGKGIEMEQDFEGTLEDMPQNDDGAGSEAEDGEEDRLQQEMGDVGEGADVVDEQLWGDQAGEEAPGQEMFEKDAPVQVPDKSNLEYQAGQEDGGENEQPGSEEQQQPGKESAPPDAAQPEGDQALEEEGPVNEDSGDRVEDRHFVPPTAPEQELDLPEDMALDDAAPQDGDGEPAADDQAADPVDEGPAGQEPSKQDPEKPTGDTEPDITAAGDTEEAEIESEAAPEAAAEGEQAGDQQETQEQPNAEQGQPEVQEQGEEGPDGEAPLGGQDPAGKGQQEHQAAEAGPKGAPAAAPLGAGEQGNDAAAQAAGLAQGSMEDHPMPQAEQESRQHAPMPAQMPEGGLHMAPGMQPQGQPSSLGMAEAGRGAGPQPTAAEQGVAGRDGQAEMREANPFRGLGDALQQWHARLAMAGEAAVPQPQDAQAGTPGAADEPQAPDAKQPLGLGEYEFLTEKEGRQQGDAQTLAPASEEQARRQMESLQGPDQEIPDADSEGEPTAAAHEEPLLEEGPEGNHQQAAEVLQQQQGGAAAGGSKSAQLQARQPAQAEAEGVAEPPAAPLAGEEAPRDTAADSFVAALLQRASISGQEAEGMLLGEGGLDPEAAEQLRRHMEERVARASEGGMEPQQREGYGQEMWGRCEALTAGLASELAEQLRLILEPTLASKLAGEYRTGKRISMRRVIGYIASHYRKDKIWLRRTRPDIRRYQVVIAVDDSRSMAENACGPFALEALALLSRALAGLNVGELGVVSFGGSAGVQPLHPLGTAFTDSDGMRVMGEMRFDQDNTIKDQPMVELLSSLQALLAQARHRSGPGGIGLGTHDLRQLVLVIADGRFHEKESLRQAVADFAAQKGVLLAFIVLDNPASSLLDMQTVNFAGGKPVFSKYIDSFPFPFYIVLRDIAALPRTLADLLRQWFQLSSA